MMRPERRGAAAKPPARLLRLHRHSLVSILVTGGTSPEREAMASAFHRASPLRGRPFVTLDCGRDESTLRRALRSWLLIASGMVEPNPLREVGGGTLFLDRLEELPAPVQQQLLLLARHIQGGPGMGASPMPARLAAGSAAPLIGDSPGGIAPELLDCLDKIRIEVGVAEADAEVDSKGPAEAERESGLVPPEEAGTHARRTSMAAGELATRSRRSADRSTTRQRPRRFALARERRDFLEDVRLQVQADIERALPAIVKSRIMRLLDQVPDMRASRRRWPGERSR